MSDTTRQMEGQKSLNIASDGKLLEGIWYACSGVWCENKYFKWIQTLRKLPAHAARMPFEYKWSVNNACSIKFRNPPDRRVEDSADWERRGTVSDNALPRHRLAQLTSQTHIMDYFTKYSNMQLCWWHFIVSLNNETWCLRNVSLTSFLFVSQHILT
jgi:hypothetical protein